MKQILTAFTQLPEPALEPLVSTILGLMILWEPSWSRPAPPSHEKHLFQKVVEARQTKPGGLPICLFPWRGQRYALNCTIVTAVRAHATPGEGSLLDQTAATKLRENRALCEAAGWTCIPFVASTYGALHATPREFICSLIAKTGQLTEGGTPAKAGRSIWSAVTAAVIALAASQIRRHWRLDQPFGAQTN